MIDPWIIVLGAGVGLLVVAAVAWLRGRRRDEQGTPAPEILDDTEPLSPQNGSPGALTQCPHGRPLSRGCEECDRQWRAPHVTLDDDEPKGAA